MRLLLGMVLAGCLASHARADDCASSRNPSPVVSWRPRAWHPPASSAAAAGLRLDPDRGVAASPGPTDFAAIAAARRQARANLVVRTAPDGSRHLVLDGIIRGYTIARVRPDGRLIEECVSSEEEARRRISAPPKER